MFASSKTGVEERRARPGSSMRPRPVPENPLTAAQRIGRMVADQEQDGPRDGQLRQLK